MSLRRHPIRWPTCRKYHDSGSKNPWQLLSQKRVDADLSAKTQKVILE